MTMTMVMMKANQHSHQSKSSPNAETGINNIIFNDQGDEDWDRILALCHPIIFDGGNRHWNALISVFFIIITVTTIIFSGGNPPLTNPQLFTVITVKTHGGILTGGNMLGNHDEDLVTKIRWAQFHYGSS